jgi:hypothetical protein
MENHAASPQALAFVYQLLGTGVTLVRLLDDLLESSIAKGSDADDSARGLIEALTGTVGVHLRGVAPPDFQRATELMELTMGAVLTDLQRAVELADRRDNRTPRRRSGLERP